MALTLREQGHAGRGASVIRSAVHDQRQFPQCAVPIDSVHSVRERGLVEHRGRRRVFVPQALGADEFMRVTWHEGRQLLVFSHWVGDHCVAATPVRVDDVGELAALTVAALASSVETTRDAASDVDWSPPRPADVVHLGRPA